MISPLMNPIGWRFAVCCLTLSLVAACSGSSNNGPPAVAPPAPVAQADSAETDNGAEVLITVLANDSGTSLRLLDLTTPAHGEAQIVGTQIRYRPNDGHLGTDVFSYRVTDQAGAVASAQVTVRSFVKLKLEGRVLAVRDEQLVVSARPAEAVQAMEIGSAGDYALEIRSERANLPLLIEAIGPETIAPVIGQHYVSLLPELGDLVDLAECTDSGCTLTLAQEPRLLLGTLPTAEYGLLLGHASAVELQQPGVRRKRMGYLVGETLVIHAALLDRALTSNESPAEPLQSTDSLELAASIDDLRKVERAGGSGADLQGRRNAIIAQPGWSGTLGQINQNLPDAGLLWLTAPDDTRLHSAWWWRDGRLLNMADVGRESLANQTRMPRLSIDVAVDAVLPADGSLVLRPVDPAEALARRELEQTQRSRRLELRPLLASYARVLHWGTLDDDPAEVLLRDEIVTLPRLLPFASPPSEVLTTLPTDANLFLHGVLTLNVNGTFLIDGSTPGSGLAGFVNFGGEWNLDAQTGSLELRHNQLSYPPGPPELSTMWIHLLAEGTDRSLMLVRRSYPDGRDVVSAPAWLEAPYPAPIPLPEPPFQCLPASDAYLPIPAPPTVIPAGVRYLALADGTALRYSDTTSPEQLPGYLHYGWRRGTNGIFVFAQTSDFPWQRTYPFDAVASVGDATLISFWSNSYGPGPVFPAAVEQVFGLGVLYDCRPWSG